MFPRPADRALRSLLFISAAVVLALLPHLVIASAPDLGSRLTLIASGELARNGTALHSLAIDVATPCTFLLIANPGVARLEMIAPSGHVWTAAPNLGKDAEAPDHTRPLAAGSMTGIDIPQPELGEWHARVTALSLPDTAREMRYAVTLVQDKQGKGPVLRTLDDDAIRHRGDPVVLRVSLRDANVPVTGADVHASGGPIRSPGSIHLDLRDDGRPPDAKPNDGIYAGQAPHLDGPGPWGFSIEAKRRRPSGALEFQRTTEQYVLLSEGHSRIGNQYAEFLRDTDHDGTPDRLVIQVAVHVTEASTLGLTGHLRDAQDHGEFGMSPPKPRSPGVQMFDVSFLLDDLYRVGATGPLTLDTLRLFEVGSTTVAPLDLRTDAYTTHAYSREQLMTEAIRFPGRISAHGVDRDGNGKFEALIVDVGIDLQEPGSYMWHAVLKKGESRWLSQGQERGPLHRGMNTITFEFPGGCIVGAPAEGEFKLEGIYVGALQLPGQRGAAQGHGYICPGLVILDAPAPGRFETSKATDNRSSRGGSYFCQ